MKPFVNSGRKTVKAEEPPSVPFVLYGVAPRPRRTCLDGRILPAFFYCLTISFNPHPPCRETPCGIGRLICSGIFALPRKCTLQRCGKCGMDLRVEVGCGELAAMSSFKLTGNGNFFHIHGTDSSIAARACILHRRAERASVVMELFICRRFLFFLKKSRCKITK